MGRAPCCDKRNVKRGPWSPEEDAILRSYVEMYGTGGNWIALPQKAGLKRCGKSCRLRWLNYLRPDIKHGGFTEEEDAIICSLYNSIGSRWSIIASKLPGRTDNDIKNYWNTKLKKKFMAGLITTTTTTTSSSSGIHSHLPPPPPLPLLPPDHLPTIKAESFAAPPEDLLAQVYAFAAHQITRPQVSPSAEEVSASSSSITVDNNNNNNNNNNSSSGSSSGYNWSNDGDGGDDAFFFCELGFGSPMASDFNCLPSTWGSNSEMKLQGMYQSLTSLLVSEMQDKQMN